MKVIDYLKEVYGYSVPIFLKDIRIGGKSKQAIRKELSRATGEGKIVRKSQGVYCFKENEQYIDRVTFESIVEKKFIKDDYGIPGLELNIYGYYSGQTFLNQIGISQQVPAIVEITTNNTSCKRIFSIGKRKAILRKGKITINRFNYRALQFFDVFYLLDKDEVKDNYDLLFNYIRKYLSKSDFEQYIGLYSFRIMKLIVEGGLINAFR